MPAVQVAIAAHHSPPIRSSGAKRYPTPWIERIASGVAPARSSLRRRFLTWLSAVWSLSALVGVQAVEQLVAG